MNNKIYINTHLNNDEFYYETYVGDSFKGMTYTPIDRHYWSEEYKDVYRIYNVTKDYPWNSINNLNKFFGEFCSLYYVWKNNIQSDYVTFCQYRRFIYVSSLDFEKLSNDYIQYYYTSFIDTLFCISSNANNPESISDKIRNSKFPFLTMILSIYNLPPFLEQDVMEYCDSKFPNHKYDVEGMDKFLDENTTISYPLRSVFSCNWKVFNEVMDFIGGFIEHILNKYDIWDYDKHVEWLENYVITWYRNNKDTFRMVNATEDVYDQIYSPVNHYGLYSSCTVWRIESYILEMMLSFCILNKINVFNC